MSDILNSTTKQERTNKGKDKIPRRNLNNLVNLFLDIAENNAERSITMYMEDWKNEVENALKVFHYEVLEGKGKISHKQAV